MKYSWEKDDDRPKNVRGVTPYSNGRADFAAAGATPLEPSPFAASTASAMPAPSFADGPGAGAAPSLAWTMPPSSVGAPTAQGMPPPSFARGLTSSQASRVGTGDDPLEGEPPPPPYSPLNPSPPPTQGLQGPIGNDPKTGKPYTEYHGIEYWATRGIKPENMFFAQDHPTKAGQLRPEWKRTANGYELVNEPQYEDDTGGPSGIDKFARDLTGKLTADGHTVKPTGINTLMIDGRPYTVREPPKNPIWTPTFGPDKPPYTPGEITFDDLEGYSFSEMMDKLKTPQDELLDSLVSGVLANPESLSPQMVETLKAKSADELASIGTAQQEELGRYGWLTGNEDSNWLKSEQLSNQRGRDQALIGSNREIDIKAAETNMADRLNAAGMGMNYQAEQRGRAALAADTSLRAAAQRGDRLALREAIAQKAAELRLDADDLMQQYVIAQMEDLTKRYGIQVAADIDIARLSLQSQQFQEDLAFKLTELGMRWEEFLAKNQDT